MPVLNSYGGGSHEVDSLADLFPDVAEMIPQHKLLRVAIGFFVAAMIVLAYAICGAYFIGLIQ